jgi:3-oxoacyl-[acyl-carrier-protein] synthase II
VAKSTNSLQPIRPDLNATTKAKASCMSGHDVLITGIGLLSCLGEGVEAHWNGLTGAKAVIVDDQSFPPYTVHPLPGDIDWALQIPRKEQRQMEQWQRIGTYTAGLALHDAGIKDNEELTATMDMIVAAGGGERDVSVDTQILDASRTRNDREVMLNEKLTTELRPTLFLAQLSNLLAGNISIVHKVTGSSRTFMGEEGSGISALQTGLARIRSGQSTHLLVGGGLNAEHPDTLLSYELAGLLKRDGWSPLWQRQGSTGGVIAGSGGAFLVLESREHAAKRGAKAYAQLVAVSSNQANRSDDGLSKSISAVLDDVSADSTTLLISAAAGAEQPTQTEKAVLTARNQTAVRAVSGIVGHMKEAQFPFAVALAALAVSRNSALPVFDASFETDLSGNVERAAALAVGYHRAEGAALLKRA